MVEVFERTSRGATVNALLKVLADGDPDFTVQRRAQALLAKKPKL